MPTKTFNYEIDGLSYTVVLTETDSGVTASITVNEGHMDVNALYWGDDEFDGESVNLGGPLNMNGAGSQLDGEPVEWDDALALSSPGLGPDGTDKETYLTEGETLTVELDGLTLDDIEFFGIRATSTSNDEGSIKGVSAPDEDNGDDDDDDDDDGADPATYEKVFFVDDLDNLGGLNIIWGDLSEDDLVAAGLDPDAEGTFENHIDYFEYLNEGFLPEGETSAIPSLEAVIFYDSIDPLNEVGRIEGPFEDRDALLDAYAEFTSDFDTSGLMIAMDLGEDDAGSDDDIDDGTIAA